MDSGSLSPRNSKVSPAKKIPRIILDRVRSQRGKVAEYKIRKGIESNNMIQTAITSYLALKLLPSNPP